ncbi:MAG: hypothetical protein KGH63_02140, partial [Candidatus Micrarchaeota archaeon]|nr:hypothetical protein [Candidatus Micrarchaeota archaeon]
MKNKKFLGSLLVALLLLCGLAAASVSPKMELVNYSLSEDPVQPGHTLLLTLHLKSIYSDNCAENVAVQLTTSYPLSISGSDTQYLGTLCSNAPDSATTVVFALPVDNLASSGTYSVAVATTYEQRFSKFSEANTLNIHVAGTPRLVASVASSTPLDIYPGDEGTVTVAIDNIGNSIAQSVRATFTSNTALEVKWAGAQQGVGAIPGRSSSNVVFSIEAPKDLPAGTYPVLMHLAYATENQSAQTSDFTFEVPVKPKAQFDAHEADGGLLAGASENVAITLTNTGDQEARKLKVNIQPLFPFSTDGTVRYVDSLKPGQSVNLTYTIT